MKTFMQILILLALFQTTLQWSSYGDIRTGRVNIVTSTLNSMNFISMDITYSNTISRTTSCGIGIVKYDANAGNDFSVNVTIINFLTNMMRITALALDTTVLNALSINYIVVGADTYFLEVQFLCFLPTVISQGNGTRVENITKTTLFTTNNIACQTFFSGFRVHNSQGILNELKVDVSCPAKTSLINLSFTATQNNTASLICYTTLIFCEECTQILYYQWGIIGSQLIQSQADVSSMTVGGRYKGDDRTFWGLSYIKTSRGINKVFNFKSDYYKNNDPIDTDYTQSISAFAARLSYFFIARRGCNTTIQQWFHVSTQTCEADNSCSNTTQTLPGGARFCHVCHYTCKDCQGSLITNCTDCEAADFRVHTGGNTCPCRSQYIDINQPRCIQCSFYIPGCISCLTTSICQTCGSGFSINPSTGGCMCNSGFLVTGVCTTIIGCISATNMGGISSCLTCNSTSFYVRTVDFKCTCATGYSYNSISQCINICGDSLVVQGQACDDGNTINGDGCSSTCQTEASWFCDNNPQPSLCYISSILTSEIKYVRRILSQNTGQFAIKLSPYLPVFISMNFSANVTTNMPCSSLSVKFIDNLLKINCTYSQTLQGNSYYYNITLDPRYFTPNNTLSITLPASAINAKLTLDQNHYLNQPFKVIIIILASLSLFVMFITTITERMIGVQLILTLQSVLYAMSIMKVCPSTLSSLQNLKYSSGYNSVFGSDLIRTYPMNFSLSTVGIEQQFLLSYNLFYFLNIGILSIVIGLKLVLNWFESNKANLDAQDRTKYNMEDIHPFYFKIKRLYKLIFERIMFLSLFSNVFVIIFGTAAQLSYQSPDYTLMLSQLNLLMCGLAIFMAIIFLVMVVINSIYPTMNLFPLFMAKNYPAYYAIYTALYIIFISFLYTQGNLIYILAGMTAANMIILLLWAPYPQRIHNLTIVFNQGTVLLSLLTYIVQIQFTKRSQNNQNLLTIALMLIVVCLYICLILSIIRIIYYYKYMTLHKLSYEQAGDSNSAKKDNSDRKKSNKKDVQLMLKNNVSKEDYLSADKDKQQYLIDIKASIDQKPLNMSIDHGPQTKRQPENSFLLNNRQDNDNLDNFQTFSKSKVRRNPSIFKIDPIDPNPRVVNASQPKSAYNYDGDTMKLHNFLKDEEEFDALKQIKHRLRKDFYQKINGHQQNPIQIDQMERPLKGKSQFIHNKYDQ